MKFATTPTSHYPPHLRYIATLPWEIDNSNFLQIFSRRGRKCKQVAFFVAPDFVIDPQILIFSVFNIASFSPYWLQIKFSMSLFLYLFTFCDKSVASEIHHSRCHCSVCQRSTWYSATSTRF